MAEFLQTGGDPEWLLGLHRAPEKLRKLSELITKEHIQVQWAEGWFPKGAQGTGWGMVDRPGTGIEQIGLSLLSRPC
jgi:hypothetical protein